MTEDDLARTNAIMNRLGMPCSKLVSHWWCLLPCFGRQAEDASGPVLDLLFQG